MKATTTLWMIVLAAGCNAPASEGDASISDARVMDARELDVSMGDASIAHDSGGDAGRSDAAMTDATTTLDGAMADVSARDSGPFDAGPPVARNVSWTATFEDGVLHRRGEGDADASASLTATTRVGGTTCTVTSITRANPGVLTYSGCPDPAERKGFQALGIGGMTDLNGTLIRACNVDASANTFEMCTDNWPAYTANSSQLLGTFDVDTRGMPAYTGGGMLQGFANGTTAAGGLGPDSGYENRVVESGDNVFETDRNVLCRSGAFCFHLISEYMIPNEEIGNNGKNKPRATLNPNTNAAGTSYDTETWLGFSMFVPTDQCEEAPSDSHVFSNILATLNYGTRTTTDHLALRYWRRAGDPSSRWVVGWSHNPSGQTENMRQVNLPIITKGVWHDFVFQYRAHITSGFVRAWHNETRLVGGAWVPQEPTLMIEQEGGFGNQPVPGDSLSHTLRQYKYGWHHNASTCRGTMTFGWDDIRFGQTLRDGTGFSDVHPSGLARP